VSFAHFGRFLLMLRAEIILINENLVPILLIVTGEIEVDETTFLFMDISSWLLRLVF